MTSCHSVIHPYLLDLLSECFVFFTLRKLLPHMLVSGPHVNTQLLPSPTITPPTTNGVLTLVALVTVCLKWVIPPSWKLQPPLRLLMSSSHKLRQEFKCLYKMNQKPAGLYQKKNHNTGFMTPTELMKKNGQFVIYILHIWYWLEVQQKAFWPLLLFFLIFGSDVRLSSSYLSS